MNKGKFITFEGGEGTGKSTQVNLLCNSLIDAGIKVIRTREPGGTMTGEKIREILVKGKADKISPVTELLLNFAARKEHLEKVIKPTLAIGDFLVSDRFTDSSIAYQGFAHGLGKEFVNSIADLIIGNFKPDLTLIFDIEVEKGLGRTIRRKHNENRYESMETQFHEKVREGFLSILENEPERCVLIDASKSISDVHSDVIALVMKG